ncbi:MAG: hypothetical protein SNJ59_15860 [Aggregatilineales bacterium]
MSRYQDAVQALYDNETLREELVDEEAIPLLRWAEEKIAQLDAEYTDDAAFKQAVGVFIRLLDSINLVVGRRGYAPAEAQRAALEALTAHAAELGIALPAQEAEAMTFSAQAAQDNLTVLNGLLSQIDQAWPLAGTAAFVAQAEPPPMGEAESAPPEDDMPVTSIRTSGRKPGAVASFFSAKTPAEGAAEEDDSIADGRSTRTDTD